MNKARYTSTEVQSLFRMIATINEIEKSFASVFREYDLSLIQYWILTSLHQASPSSLRLNQLAKKLNSSHQNIKQICVNLEKKGWVSLSPDPMDKRSTMVLLSDQFEIKRFELDLLFDRHLNRLYYRLSKEDFYRLSILLERLQENTEALIP
jgi:DNA-binding MarR family transcriptional regulator